MNSYFKNILFVMLLLCLTSCSAIIESSSANSISAILSVIGEYSIAGISLIALLLIHCIRISGISISTISIYMLHCNLKLEQLAPSWLLLIGLLLIASSFITPIKYHEPKIVIAKNVAKIKNKESKTDSHRSLISEIVVGVIIGVIIIILEQNIDFTFIK